MSPRLWLLLAAPLSLSGCSTLSYYWQAASGQLELLCAREPIARLLDDTGTEPGLRDKLSTASAARAYAIEVLRLPDNGSYTSYADIGRPYLLWNVVATPELSLAPRRWCFPIAGCVSYRGYFRQAAAEALAEELRAQGLDVAVGGVAAYSTLGWFEDPVVNTMLGWPDHALAALIMHELAHQKVYVAGDSAFNEAYATAVAELGLTQWLADADGSRRAEAQAARARQRDFVALTTRYRDRLERLYASALNDAEKRTGKSETLREMQAEYQALRASWGGYTGWDHWFAELNNARIAAVATYHDLVPAFLALHRSVDGEWDRFHAAVEAAAALDEAARKARVESWLSPA